MCFDLKLKSKKSAKMHFKVLLMVLIILFT